MPTRRARAAAHRLFRFAASGWKVMSELPNVSNFAAAASHVRESDMAELVPSGPDPETHIAAINRWEEAGFEHLALTPVGDVDAFFELWQRELRPRLAGAARA